MSLNRSGLIRLKYSGTSGMGGLHKRCGSAIFAGIIPERSGSSMADALMNWRDSVRGGQKEGSLGQFLDQAFDRLNTIGSSPWRGPTNWGPSPRKFEVYSLAGVASTSGGGLGAWQPNGGPLAVVLRCIVAIKV